MENSAWIVTGGTGSFGQRFVRYVLDNHSPTFVTVFSRDEHKQHDMQQLVGDDRVRYVLGDVRDRDTVMREMKEHDSCIHTAALKHVGSGQTQPGEVARTNIDGTRNVVDAANKWATTMVLLSTDKAVAPANYYGATKMLAEGITLTGGQRVVRYGNVWGSRGSVLHKFREAAANGHKFRITDKRMTRFVITLNEAVQVVLQAFDNEAGTVTIPKLPAMRIVDLARAFDEGAEFEEIGIQPGEKLAEDLGGGQTSDKARMLSVEEIREMIDGSV